MNSEFDDLPLLVDPDFNLQPLGANFMAGYQTPHCNVHAGWTSTIPQQHSPFPSQSAAQEQWARWNRHVAPDPPSMPSPYIPHVPFPETRESAQSQYGPPKRRNSTSVASSYHSNQRASSWNTWQPSPFHMYTRPPAHSSFSEFTTPTSTSTAISMSRSVSASYVPPDWPGDPPKSWRRDFKFKSGFSSLFRSRSVSRPPEEYSDSARLNFVALLRYDKARPPVILDLRRSQYSLMFRGLDRPVSANDMMQPTTDPPTTFMRLYHARLPWYIDVVPSGNYGPYVTLGDFFTAVCQSLAARIHQAEYYNDQLDEEDREALKQAWEERCMDREELMDGVRRVDFLRGKYMFRGLTRGKNGMWQLRTGRE